MAIIVKLLLLTKGEFSHERHSLMSNEGSTIYATSKEAVYCTAMIKHDGHFLKQEGNEENTSRTRVFSTFLECSQMSGVYYHSVIHGLGFFICFMIYIEVMR